MTREEIARAFRDAQETINELAVFSGNYPPKHQPFADRAAQVEQMRCETCAKELDYKISGRALIGNYTCKTPCPWQGCGGCFNHKPKGN